MKKAKTTPAPPSSNAKGRIDSFFRAAPQRPKEAADRHNAGASPPAADHQDRQGTQPEPLEDNKVAEVPGEALGTPAQHGQHTPAESLGNKRRATGVNNADELVDSAVATSKRQKNASACTPATATAAAPASPIDLCMTSSSATESNAQQPAEGSNLVDQAAQVSHAADGADSVQEQSTSQVQHSSSQVPKPGPGQGSAAAGDKPHVLSRSSSQGPAHQHDLSDLAMMIEDTKAALGQELLLPSLKTEAAAADQVAIFIEGRRCGLEDLVKALAEHKAADAESGKAGGAGDAVGGQTASDANAGMSLREQVLYLATRKAFGVKEGLPDGPAAFEDQDPEAFWFWELSDLKKSLGSAAETPVDKAAAKMNRKLVELYRKRRKELHDRLAAASLLHELLVKAGAAAATAAAPGGGDGEGDGPVPKASPAKGKASKGPGKMLMQRITATSAKLDKLPTLAQIEVSLEAGIAQVCEKDSERLNQLQAKRKEREAVEATRQAERQAKAAQKDKEKAEKAAAKAIKGTGFNSTKGLVKSQAMMANFFKMSVKTPVAAQAGAAGGASGPSSPLAAPRLGGLLAPEVSQPPNCLHSPGGRGGAATVRGGGQQLAAWLEQQRELLDPVLPAPGKPPVVTDMEGLLQELKQDWRQQAAAQRQALKGAPPSWARRPGPQPSFHEQCIALWGHIPPVVRVIRKKLLAFKENVRPPYYGSWSRVSDAVRARRPFVRDSGLEYDMDSDDEWEEEPEGTDLGACSDEEMSEVRNGAEDEEEEEPGFVVDDGYLSGDEGAKLDEDMDIDWDAPVAGGGANGAADPRFSAMEAGVLRALRTNRPLLLSQLPGGKCDPPSTLDARLLRALAGTLLQPGAALVQLPKDWDVYTLPPKEDILMTAGSGQVPDPSNAMAPAAGPHQTAAGTSVCAGTGPATGVGAGGGAGSGRGRPVVFPEWLMPRLEAYLRESKERAIDKLVDGFLMLVNGLSSSQPAAVNSDGAAMAGAPDATTPKDSVQGSAGPVQGIQVSKNAVKVRIKAMATYQGIRGWVLNSDADIGTPARAPGNGSSQQPKTPATHTSHPTHLPATTPASTTAAPPSTSAAHLFTTATPRTNTKTNAATPAPAQTPRTNLFNTTTTTPAAATAATTSEAPTTTGSHLTAPSPAARVAAAQIMAGLSNHPHHQPPHPAGAPTPFPTPSTTFPVPGGSLSVPAPVLDSGGIAPGTTTTSTAAKAAGDAAKGQGGLRQARLWAPAQPRVPGAAGAAQATPITPIPCGLLAGPAPGGVSATPAPAPGPPRNTPATAVGERQHHQGVEPGQLQQRVNELVAGHTERVVAGDT